MKNSIIKSRRSIILVGLVTAVIPWMSLAHAADYPAGPIALMVPYPAGGASDVSARILSNPIGKELGATLIVENLGGATGTIAASKVLNAKADGSIIFQGTQNELIIPPLTNRAVTYQPDAFELTQPSTITQLVLLVRNDLPAKTIQDFFKLAGKNTSKPLTYGTVGVGSLYHLMTEYMGKIMKIPFSHIPYKGAAPVMQDLSGGQIDFAIMPFQSSMLDMIKSGRYRALAVFTKNRPPLLAQIPSITEIPQLAKFEYVSSAGYYVKKGTPLEIRTALNQAIGKALQDPTVISKLEADGRNIPKRMTLAEAAAAYEAEIAKYKEMIRITGYVQTE